MDPSPDPQPVLITEEREQKQCAWNLQPTRNAASKNPGNTCTFRVYRQSLIKARLCMDSFSPYKNRMKLIIVSFYR